MGKNIFYLIIFVMIAFLVIDLFFIFARRAPFEIVYYRTNMEYDYDGNATFTTVAGLFFKDPRKRESYRETYLKNSKETFQEYFKKVGEEVGRDIIPVSFDSTVMVRSGILEISETAFLKNVAIKKDGAIDTSMGSLTLNIVGDSEVSLKIPEGATIVSIDPTPTSIVGKTIKWRPKGPMLFPRVIFKKK